MPEACGLWFHKQKCPRPREKWQKKDPKEKRKRKRAPKSAKTQKPANEINARGDAATPGSDDSSPADTDAPYGDDNDLADNDEEVMGDAEPQLPPMPRHVRANSAGPIAKGLGKRVNLGTGQREVHSSPGGVQGSDAMPIEIDLTPKPLRRQLFPSPNKGQSKSDSWAEIASVVEPDNLPFFVRRSPRLHRTKEIFERPEVGSSLIQVTAGGKENIAPAIPLDNAVDQLFDEQDTTVFLEPSTPTPKRRSERLLFKTPSKTPTRHFGLDLSPNIRDSPNSRNESRKQIQHPVVTALLGTVKKDISEMTPFTRSIHEALSDAHELGLATPLAPVGHLSDRVTRSGKKATPNKSLGFDFPDLPSLKNSSPMTGDDIFNLNFSELTTDQLNTDFNDIFSTDAPMPSSPPIGFYNFINVDDDDADTGLWASINLSGEPPDQQSTYPDPASASLAVSAIQTPRRSPRRRA